MDRSPHYRRNSRPTLKGSAGPRTTARVALLTVAGIGVLALAGGMAWGADSTNAPATNPPAVQSSKALPGADNIPNISANIAAGASASNASSTDSADVDAAAAGAASGSGIIVIKDQQEASPLVLNQDSDYVLDNVRVLGIIDQAALTLTGSIHSVAIRHSRFGEAVAGGNGRAAGMEAVGASVRSLTVSDTVFCNCENQLVSLKEGSFGIVTFEHCVFKNSDAFLKGVYSMNSGRTSPPVTEFYNIDRLELLDNDFENTTIIIHPSVKTVVFRGDISHLQIESPDTQVLRLAPGEAATDIAEAVPAEKPQASLVQPPASRRSSQSAVACAS